MEQIYCSLGPIHFCCAFWMEYNYFCILHHKLNYIGRGDVSFLYLKGGGGGGSFVPPPVQNGAITNKTRIACALQYFCDASPYDLMSNFDILQPEMMKSVWFVVKAVNQVDEFCI